MKPRKTLLEMSCQTEQVQVSGRPADKCPYCEAGMFVDGVSRTDGGVARYIECRNCKRRFLTYQAAAKIVREITRDNSADGKPTLSLVSKAV